MSYHAAGVRPVVAELLESRTLWSASPILSPADVSPTSLGQLVSTGKVARFDGSMPNGTPFTVEVKTGSVQLSQLDSTLYVSATNTIAQSWLRVIGSLTVAQVSVAGPLKFFRGDNLALIGNCSFGAVGKFTVANSAGTLAFNGSLGVAKIGSLTGVLASSGDITRLTLGVMNNAKVLSGVNLGADGLLGGGDDTYSAGSIGNMSVAGPLINSDIIVGVSPGVDGVFGTADDSLAGGGLISRLLLSDGADPNSHIEAGGFGSVRTATFDTLQPARRLADPLSDSHFSVPR